MILFSVLWCWKLKPFSPLTYGYYKLIVIRMCVSQKCNISLLTQAIFKQRRFECLNNSWWYTVNEYCLINSSLYKYILNSFQISLLLLSFHKQCQLKHVSIKTSVPPLLSKNNLNTCSTNLECEKDNVSVFSLYFKSRRIFTTVKSRCTRCILNILSEVCFYVLNRDNF